MDTQILFHFWMCRRTASITTAFLPYVKRDNMVEGITDRKKHSMVFECSNNLRL